MLKRLYLERVRCFAELDLAFTTPAPTMSHGRGWTILVGENGVGKTTILQAITLASVDTRAVSALVEAPWTLTRQGTPLHSNGVIRLAFTRDGREIEAERRIPAREGAYIEQPGRSSVSPPLLMAFAARRRIARSGESPPSKNLEVERVRGLFDTDQPLLRHDPFQAFEADADRRSFASVVRDVLLTRLNDDAALFPLINSLELRGQGGVTKSKQLLEGRRFELRYGDAFGVRVALQDLSDGYQSMFALVTEILIQSALATKIVPTPHTLEAVILIDEIEAHLHPRWQRTVVPLLRKVFPLCQFVVSTHSPLVVGSAEPGEVHVLEVTAEGDVIQETLDERLAMHGADKIYEEVFGVFRTAPPDLVESEREYLKQYATGHGVQDEEIANLIESAWRDAKSSEA